MEAVLYTFPFLLLIHFIICCSKKMKKQAPRNMDTNEFDASMKPRRRKKRVSPVSQSSLRSTTKREESSKKKSAKSQKSKFGLKRHGRTKGNSVDSPYVNLLPYLKDKQPYTADQPRMVVEVVPTIRHDVQDGKKSAAILSNPIVSEVSEKYPTIMEPVKIEEKVKSKKEEVKKKEVKQKKKKAKKERSTEEKTKPFKTQTKTKESVSEGSTKMTKADTYTGTTNPSERTSEMTKTRTTENTKEM